MIRYLMFLVILLVSLSFCISTEDLSTAGFGKLSETEKAEMVKLVAAKVQETDSASKKSTTAQVSEWVDLGIKLGSALASCAKELGVAVDAFLGTNAGKLTFLLIAWKVMASDIIHLGGGITFLIVGFFLFRSFQRSFRAETIEYDTEKKTWFGRPMIKERKYSDFSEEKSWVLFLIAFVFAVAAAVSIFTI